MKMREAFSFANLFFFNWDSPYARLNSHYETWSYNKKYKNIKTYGEFV